MSRPGIARYRILDRIGAGGMGVVYRAEDTSLQRPVALKFLPGECSSREESRARFLQEARTAASLNHPNIYIIHEVGEVGPDAGFDPGPGNTPVPPGTPYIAMELVEGETLHEILAGTPELPLHRLLDIAIQIAEGLSEAHAHGVVHRDLKPANVAVTQDGLVKVLDFGLAKLVGEMNEGAETLTATEESGPLSRPGAIAGTARYMSPEQATGRKVDARSDVFSFGAVLYEMVTGRRAFGGSSLAETLASVAREQPKAPSELAVEVPKELERLILRCLQKDPERRFQHMVDVRVELQEIKEEGGPPSRLTSGPGDDYLPSWSRDGRFIYYASDRAGGRAEVWRIPAAGGSEERVTHGGGSLAYESADGKTLFFMRESFARTSLLALRLAGGPERKVLECVPPLGFAVGPGGVYHFACEASPAGTPLYVLDPATGRDRLLATVEKTDGGLAVSPDGKTFFYPKGGGEGSDLMMIENFR